jgi:hypothetical protein
LGQLQTLQRGSTLAQVKALTKTKNYTVVKSNYQNASYLAQIMSMQTGTISRVSTSCFSTGCVVIPISVPTSAPYFSFIKQLMETID